MCALVPEGEARLIMARIKGGRRQSVAANLACGNYCCRCGCVHGSKFCAA